MPGIPNRPYEKKAPHPSKRGFLGDVGHVISGTSRGLYHGVTGLPTGVYMTGRAIGHDTGRALTGQAPNRVLPLIENVGKAEYNSYRHFGKGGDVSGPVMDALAALTGGAGAVARGSKAISEVSRVANDARAARAAELGMKDMAVGQVKQGNMSWDDAAKMIKTNVRELKAHSYKNFRYMRKSGQFGTKKDIEHMKKYASTPVSRRGNMQPRLPGHGVYANETPDMILKNPKHELFDFYAERNPHLISNKTRARKSFMQKPQYSRPLLAGKPFEKKRSGLYVPTSPNPVFRGIRSGVEQIRPKKSAAREISKETVRRKITQERVLAPKNIRMGAQATTPADLNVAEKIMSYPMGALRVAMWLRPRYYIQNLLQTGQMLGTSPIASARSARLAGDLFKNHRDVYNMVRAVTGEAQAGALAAGTSRGRVATGVGQRIEKAGGLIPDKKGIRIARKGIQGFGSQAQQRGLQGAMGHMANIPESHARAISVLNELRRHHENTGSMSALTPAHVQRYLGNVRRSGVISPEHLPLRRSVEEVGDFGRIFGKKMINPKSRGMSEREFMATQIPIFYPMFKALTRYGVRFPSEHAIASASGLALGKQGKKEQKRLLGPLPFWGQYLIPKSAGNPNAKRSPNQAVFNPSNIYNLQPATDVARQGAEMFREGSPVPGLSFLQESGPSPGLLYGLMTGKDIQTGYPIKPFSKQTYKHHPWLNRSIFNVPYDWASSLPLSDLERLASGQRPHLRSFEPGSATSRLLQELGPGPAFIPRTLRTKETTKQAKREARYGQGRQTPKKKPYFP